MEAESSNSVENVQKIEKIKEKKPNSLIELIYSDNRVSYELIALYVEKRDCHLLISIGKSSKVLW